MNFVIFRYQIEYVGYKFIPSCRYFLAIEHFLLHFHVVTRFENIFNIISSWCVIYNIKLWMSQSFTKVDKVPQRNRFSCPFDMECFFIYMVFIQFVSISRSFILPKADVLVWFELEIHYHNLHPHKFNINSTYERFYHSVVSEYFRLIVWKWS